MKSLAWLAVIFTVDCWGAAPDVDFGKLVIKAKLRNGTGDIFPGRSFAIDGNGQYYVSGSFDRNARFGTNFLTNAHRFHPDAFIAKYDRQTNCVWVRQIHEAAAPTVAVFGAEAVFIAGEFRGDTLVGTLPVHSHGSQDAFLAKFDINGSLLWFKQAGGCEKRFGSRATSVTVDAAGNSYITGEFSGPGVFDEITLSPQGVPRALFVAKYDPAGKLLWAKKDAEGSTDPNGIAVDPSGNIYVTGDFLRTVTFGSQILTQSEGSDMFLAKYDADGNSLWARAAGGPPKRSGWNLAVDVRGDPYVAGLLFGTRVFGSTNVVIVNKRHPNSFVAKYGAGGDFQWVRQFQDGDFDFSNVVSVETVGVKHPAHASTNATSPALSHLEREKKAEAVTAALNARSAVSGGTAPRPALGIAKSGDFIVLFWSKDFAGFILEGSETLTPFPVWEAITPNPEPVADQMVVSIPIQDTVKFYRLRRP